MGKFELPTNCSHTDHHYYLYMIMSFIDDLFETFKSYGPSQQVMRFLCIKSRITIADFVTFVSGDYCV